MADDIVIDLMKHFEGSACSQALIRDVRCVQGSMQRAFGEWNSFTSRWHRATNAAKYAIDVLQTYYDPRVPSDNPPPSSLVDFANDVIGHMQRIKPRVEDYQREMDRSIRQVELERDYVASGGTIRIVSRDRGGRPLVREPVHA